MEVPNKSGGALIDDFDSHLYPSQNVLGHLYLGKSSLADGIQELVVANTKLIISRDGCKVMWHGDLLTTLMTLLSMRTTLANNTNYTNYANNANKPYYTMLADTNTNNASYAN